MKDSKLVQYLNLLPAAKLKKLREFLLVFLNKNTHAIALYDTLSTSLKKEKKLDRTYILERVFQQKISNATLNNTVGKLLTYTENFLLNLQLHTTNNPSQKNIERELIILEYLKDNKADALYFKRLHPLIEAHEKSEQKSIWHNYELMRLKHEAYYNKRDFTKNKLDKEEKLPKILKLLDSFYEDFAGRYYLECLVRSKIMQENLVEPIFRPKDDENNSIYWQLIKLFESKVNDELFEEILLNFKTNFHKFPSREQQNILLYLVNYASRQTKGDDMQQYWAKKIFTLYNWGYKNDTFTKNGITNTSFCNAIIVATNLNKIKWAKAFRLSYKDQLPKEEKDNSLLLVNMYILFTEKKHQKLIDLYHNQKSKDLQIDLVLKTLVLFSKYKSTNYTEYLVIMDCERGYNTIIQNNKLSDAVKKAAANFFICIKALTKRTESKFSIAAKMQKRPLLMQLRLKKELENYKMKERW